MERASDLINKPEPTKRVLSVKHAILLITGIVIASGILLRVSRKTGVAESTVWILPALDLVTIAAAGVVIYLARKKVKPFRDEGE